MARWTTQQVIALAPDDRAIRAAKGLARPGPWSDLGSTDALLWGKCQGSGATPYQVSVELTEPAFRCTCPSRKLPCKHGLALLLLWVDGNGSVADVADAPDFATTWIEQRDKAASGAKRATGPVVDPVAQAKRLEQRLELMSTGLDDFERWLCDLIRQGLAAARHQPYAFWDQAAARLVDAQVPGLAERVREMGSAVHRRADWADHLLTEAGRWFLAVQAWRRREHLDAAARGDLRVVLGWAVPGEEVLQGERVQDRWVVVGVHRTDDGRLQEQRTWLRGTGSGRWALLLDFAVSGAALRLPQVTGSTIDAELALYPGSDPRRARLVGIPEVVTTREPVSGTSTPGGIDAALDQVAGTLAANPWSARTPVVVQGRTVAAADGRAALIDDSGAVAPLVVDGHPWTLLALTGGRRAEVFGEWEDGRLRPLAVALDGALVPLGPNGLERAEARIGPP